jgi:hypothetical protein
MSGRDGAPGVAERTATWLRARRVYVALSLLAVVLVAVSLPRCGWVQKAKLDREVDRLCAIDGGVHIYEVVRLPKENFGPNGEVFPQYQSLYPKGELRPNFVSGYQIDVLVAGDPSLSRSRVWVQRVADGKTLGEFVDYTRRGGDALGALMPTHKVCPSSRDSGSLLRKVFLLEKS